MSTLYSSVGTVCTARFNIKTYAFYPNYTLQWLVSFWQQTAVISIGNIRRTVFLMQAKCVLRELRFEKYKLCFSLFKRCTML